ncbi:MAG: MiaB/RimO family radical SAM methylthiotransferase [Candidatus Shapirobacteria bacterium]
MPESKKVFIKTFGCAQNVADSERIRAFYQLNGLTEVDDWRKADLVVINSCIVRESAENRVYGLVNEIRKTKKPKFVILTGCLAGLNKNKKIKGVDEIWPIEKFDLKIKPIRDEEKVALISISSGCNNFCSYCIVPYARGREKSGSFEEILSEVDEAIKNGFKEVVLIGQNVNSYGKDKNPPKSPFDKGDLILFPKLLEEVAKKPLEKISFVSSNPWDFSDELIETIAKYPNIDRLVHLPLQSGNDEILRKMNRKYTAKEYLGLVKKIKNNIKDVRFSTDIIVGFPGEDEKAFQKTVAVCKKVGFEIAYLNKYSPRKGTVAAKLYKDEIPQAEKKRRWRILDDLVNQK